MNPTVERRSHRWRIGLLFLTYICVPLLVLLRAAPLHSIPLSAGAGHGRRVGGAAPAEIERLLDQATRAVNQHKLETLRMLSAEDASTAFDWTRRSIVDWEGDVLPLPPGPFADAEPTYLAVFHAWHPCQTEGDHVHRVVHTEQGWKLGAEIPEADTLGFRVRDHDLRVALNVVQKTANIRDRIQVERTSAGIPAFVLLRLSQDFQVQSLLREETDPNSAVPFHQAGGILAFTPPVEKNFSLSLKYRGQLNHRDGDFIHENEAVLDSYWYPHIARLPAKATFTATAPPGWTPLAQGELVRSDRNAEGAITVTFRNEIPVCYFTLDMGRYTITSRQVKGRTLSAYLLSPNADLAKRCLETTARALNYYEANFGPFPYTRYGVVETKGPFDGALEAYSFSTYGPQTLPDVIPHELSHTWWGGLVPCPYTRSMWNEAFAEYSDELVQRTFRPPWKPHILNAKEAADELSERRRFARAYGAFSLAESRDTDEPRQNAIGYGKGRQVLRVLEQEIGQEALLRSMKTFLADHKQGEAGEWGEFEAAVKKTTGQDLRWFFAEWIERSGVPTVALQNVQAKREAGKTLVEGDILQSDPPYRMKMPVLIFLQNGEVALYQIEVSGERTHFQIETASPPARLTLDPEGLIPFSAPPSGDPTTYAFPQ